MKLRYARHFPAFFAIEFVAWKAHVPLWAFISILAIVIVNDVITYTLATLASRVNE